ncbi:MAG: dihydrofolate reductase [Methylotenera sp.]|nr:dihydrofolate reductase [Oligoflexia bacterium]
MIISLIAAMDQNRVIGVENRLPWHLPEDLKYFRKTTSGRPVLMGRKTFESIGRLLPNRLNVIMTRQKSFVAPEGACVVSSWNGALEEILAKAPTTEELFVIGGSEIYEMALPHADRLYITEVETTVSGGDAYFPKWNPQSFDEKKREAHDGAPRFSFVVLERKLTKPES